MDPSTLWVAEGVEIALSVAQALPHQSVMASLSVGNLKKIPVHPGLEKIVICADHDGVEATSYKGVVAALEHYLGKGLRAFVAMPSAMKGYEKVDFNDLAAKG